MERLFLYLSKGKFFCYVFCQYFLPRPFFQSARFVYISSTTFLLLIWSDLTILSNMKAAFAASLESLSFSKVEFQEIVSCRTCINYITIHVKKSLLCIFLWVSIYMCIKIRRYRKNQIKLIILNIFADKL